MHKIKYTLNLGTLKLCGYYFNRHFLTVWAAGDTATKPIIQIAQLILFKIYLNYT